MHIRLSGFATASSAETHDDGSVTGVMLPLPSRCYLVMCADLYDDGGSICTGGTVVSVSRWTYGTFETRRIGPPYSASMSVSDGDRHSVKQNSRRRITSALEVILNEMRYINLRFTYLLTYLLTPPGDWTSQMFSSTTRSSSCNARQA